MADPSSGTISFIEIGSDDADAIRSFFSSVFGWSSHDDAWLQTPTIKAGTHGADPTPQIYVYFQASDLEGAANKVRAAGGEGLATNRPAVPPATDSPPPAAAAAHSCCTPPPLAPARPP